MEKVNVFFRCLVVATLVVLGACTDYQYVDTGLANGKHDCTVWEYLHSQPDDWDSTIIMIEHAGMKEYFDGSRQNEQITFFGLYSSLDSASTNTSAQSLSGGTSDKTVEDGTGYSGRDLSSHTETTYYPSTLGG